MMKKVQEEKDDERRIREDEESSRGEGKGIDSRAETRTCLYIFVIISLFYHGDRRTNRFDPNSVSTFRSFKLASRETSVLW